MHTDGEYTLTQVEAAEMLGVCRAHVSRLVTTGVLDAKATGKFGGSQPRMLISRRSVERFMRTRNKQLAQSCS